jgi:hypothetical protein
MVQITARCEACGTTLTLDEPQGWRPPDGSEIDPQSVSADERESLFRPWVVTLDCPHCGRDWLRVVGTAERLDGFVSVYLQFTLQLERYVQVKAATMAEATAIVRARLQAGMIERPHYTEGLEDWTEVTDLPQAKSHFRLDGEPIGAPEA